ncbi:titin isoform X1, partial [Tachysurus ichikawai]
REAEILKPLASVEVVEKEEASFDTEISEDDVPGEWKLRGQILTRSPTCDIRAEGKKRFLTLKNVQLDQAGEVTYQALNAITSAMLTVKEIEMDFVVPLTDITVPEKKQAKFECTITKDVSKVIWYRGSDIISSDQKYDIIDDGKKHMLVINHSEFDDEGDYSIEVLSKTSTAKLTVEGIRLKFISPMSDQTVKEGNTARFEIELSHENVPVTWYKNETKLHPSRTVLTHVDGKRHILEIKEVTLDDTCQIKAEAKGISTTANLTVLERDAYFTVKLQDYTAVEKDDVSLDCELSKDVPVKWFHNEIEIKASKMVSMKVEGNRRILHIKKVENKDSGHYACDCGTDKTMATMNIEARDIKIVRPMYGVELYDGETARFEVELSEDDVHGQWKLKGEVLSQSPDVEIIEDGAKHTLTLYNCKVPQSGEVSFQGANAKCAANLKVKELPITFLTPLSDVQVYEKDEARFECEISREPKSFRWLKGTQELQADDKFDILTEGKRHTLLVKSAAFEDEAKYMFEAEDKRTSAKLIIQGIRLEFVKPIKDVTVKERETAEFSIELSHEKVQVIWYKNDVRLHPSKVVHMSEDGKIHTLSIKEVSIDDTSLIKAEALGKSCEAMLTVLEGEAYFTTKLQDYTAVEKDEVVLMCELSKPSAEVKWFKDGKEITPSKNIIIKADGKKRTLTVKRADKGNIGQYTCDCGTDKTTAKLNIEDRDIKVVRPLYSVEVTETETARFETEISEEDVHGNWKLKGEPLHQSPDCEIKEEGTKHMLILYNVRKDMAGGVDFSAANAKSSAQLRVKARVIGLIRPLRDVTVTAGETATFDCELSYEGISVEWFLGGTKLEPSDRVVARAEGRTHTLTLRDVKLTEAGEVKLTAKDFQIQANLIVKEPPVEFTKPLEDQTVEEEATAILECEVSKENAEVRWFRDGQEIRKTKKYEMVADGRKRKLIIHDCALDDSKTYTCDAKVFKTSAFLNVEPPHVEFSKPLHDVEVMEKETAKFECEVSRENAKVRWFKDGNDIRKGKKYDIISKGVQRILIISKSVFDDEAEYECDARTSKTSGILTVVEEEARFTKNLGNVEGTETDSIKLICEVSKSTAEVTWYKGDQELPDGGRYEHVADGRKRILIIQALHMEDAGEYHCKLPSSQTTGNLRING